MLDYTIFSNRDADLVEAAVKAAGNGSTYENSHHLWKATGTHEQLPEAKRILESQVEHGPEEYRESMLKNVRLNREIMEAWAEHGEKTVGEGDAG